MASNKSRKNLKTPSPIASSSKGRKPSGPKARAASAAPKTATKGNSVKAKTDVTPSRAIKPNARPLGAPSQASAPKEKSNGGLSAASAPRATRSPNKPEAKPGTRAAETGSSNAKRGIHLPPPKARAPKAPAVASAGKAKSKSPTSGKGKSANTLTAALGVAKAVMSVAKAALTGSSEAKQKPTRRGKAAAGVSASAPNAEPEPSAGSARLGVGDPAPSFVLRDDSGTLISSESLRGSPYILYFYPKDDTPGCTLQACGFRDSLPRFSAKGVRVLGVSADTPESHTRFKKKYGLTFPLLSDPEKTLAKAYGVWTKKTNYGREYMGIERSTFHIDKNGKVHGMWRSVRVPGHVDTVLDSV